jgi:hypothetical protein
MSYDDRVRFAIALVLLAACTDDPPAADPYSCIAGGGGGCFQLPSFRVEAADDAGTFVDPNFNCAPFEPTDLGHVAIAGSSLELFSDAPVPFVRVEMFSDLAMASRLADVESDENGAFMADIQNASSLVHWRTTADGQLPVLHANRVVATTIADFQVRSITRMRVSQLLGEVGDQFLPNKSQVFGEAYDCSGNHLMNVIANVAPSTGKNGSRLFEPGVRIYYQTDGLASRYGRRTLLHQTTPRGGFAATNLSPGHHFVQIWGFPTDADLVKGSPGLKLLAESEILVPDTEHVVVTTEYGRL